MKHRSMKKVAALVLSILLVFPLLNLRAEASGSEQSEKYGYLYEHPELKDAYNAILQGIKNRVEHMDISKYKVPSELGWDLPRYIGFENPELFYFSHINSAGSEEGDDGNCYYTNIGLEYYDEYATESHQKLFDEAVEKALSCVKPGMSDLEKACALHDYLILLGDSEIELPPEDLGAYNVLVLGNGFGNDYARAYAYLLDRCGIDSVYAADESGYADWNMIKINGQWYNVDCRWDRLFQGWHKWDYFMRSDENMAYRLETESVIGNVKINSYLFKDDKPYKKRITCTDQSYDGVDWSRFTTDHYISYYDPYGGSDKNIVIPSTLGELTVKGVADLAFKNNDNITSVTIPDTVEIIGECAFQECKNLKQVDLGNSVRKLGSGCFNDCVSITSIEIPASMTSADAEVEYGPFVRCYSLKDVTIASGGVKIPDGLFSECYALKNVIIPEGIKEIGIDAFWSCKSLEEVTIPNSVQTIGTNAFSQCESLREIILPNSIKTIGPMAFAFCSSLVDFYDYNENTEYNDEDEVTSYEYNEEGELVNISVEKVPAPIFYDVPSLTIHGYPGSNAEKYAKENSIKFVSLTGEDPGDPGDPDDPGSDPGDPEAPVVEGSMYRLYNPNSGEHFYTSNATEKNNLVSAGWTSEGSAWIAPSSSNTPVYRVYNPNSGEHHYTMNAAEKDFLVGLGWNDEGIGWYSDDNQGTPLYRLYNPNATGDKEAGGHHYTKDVNEKINLIAAGWRDEGIGWYGI